MKEKLEDFKIKESVRELQILLENCSMEDYAKLQFLLLIKEGKNISYPYIGEILKVRSKSIKEWKQLYERGGLDYLLKGKISREDNMYMEEAGIAPFIDREEKPIYTQKNENNTSVDESDDIYILREWIRNNYVTKGDFIDTVNRLNHEIMVQEDTVSVLKRIIKVLET